ncbi:MAG: hypothetical protein GY947_09305 [Rhodobacteraceae bacterium]|nr:hypothetical protein [Paracoccaceae bacterium]
MMHIPPHHNATQALELQFDGRPPMHLVQAAAAYDREQSQKAIRRRSTQVKIGSVRFTSESAIPFMASVITEAWLKRGEVSQADLTRAGFTVQQTEEWLERSLQHAIAIEPRMLAATEVGG